MICRFCGAQLPETAIYCNKCGRRLQEALHDESPTAYESRSSYDKLPESVTPPVRVDHSPYDQKPQPVKKSGKGWIVVCVALCLVIAGGLAAWRVWTALKLGLDNGDDPTAKETPAVEGEPNTDEPKTEEPKKAELSPPFQEDWTDYMEKLPYYVTSANYEIDYKFFYRSRELEKTSSTTTDSMDGWELYDTTYERSAYGPSKWSETPISSSATRKVEKKTQYLIYTKETRESSSSSLSGWKLERTEYRKGSASYFFWRWSEKPEYSFTAPKKNDYTLVEQRTVYVYSDCTLTTTYHFRRWNDDWSDWTDQKVEKSDDLDVEVQLRYRYKSKV